MRTGSNIDIQLYPTYKKFSMFITVVNNSKKVMKKVAIELKIPDGLVYITSQPEGKYDENTGNLHWKIAEITAQKELKIRITLLAFEGKCISRAKLLYGRKKLTVTNKISVA